MILFHITLVGLLLRLLGSGQSLWLDEAIGVVAVTNQSYRELFSSFLLADNHPPLYYLILKLWMDFGGTSELYIRIPSIIAGSVTVFFTYKIAKYLSNSTFVAAIAALLLATSQIHVYYSHEARMYIFTSLFAAWSIYEYLKKRWRNFSISLLLLLFSDYMTIFMLPVFWTAAIYKRHDKKWWIGFISAHIPFTFFGVLWLPHFLHQLEGGAKFLATLPEWQSVAGGATLRQLGLLWAKLTIGRISFTSDVLYLIILAIFSPIFVIGLFKARRIRTESITTIWLWLTLPVLVSFIVSVVFPAFIYFRLIYILPALYILLAFSTRRSKLSLILCTGVLFINIFALGVYYLDSYQKREQWREAVLYIEEMAGGDDVVLFSNPEPFAPYQWYQTKDLGVGATNSIAPSGEISRKIIDSVILDKNRVFYVNYLQDLMDPEQIVLQSLDEYGFEVVGAKTFHGVGTISEYRR